MEKSYKNILQEYCQKHGLDLPKYNTYKIGMTDYGAIDKNITIWRSNVTVSDITTNGIDTIKKTAEHKAAIIMYCILNKIDPNNINNNTISRTQKVDNIQDINLNPYERIFMIDGENCDFEIDKFLETDLILIFVAKNTTKNIVFDYQANYKHCYVFISEAVGKDAADHMLTFYAGILSVIDEYGVHYVLTKDHYGEFLEKFMKNCKFICSLDEI